MANFDDTFSGRDARLRLSVNETSTNSAANTSVVSWSLTVSEAGDTDFYRAFNDGTYSVVIDGTTVKSVTNWNYDFRGSVTSVTLASGTRTITHGTDGSKTISVSASADGKSPLGTASKSGSLTLTDFAFPPAAPSASPTVSRSSNGLTLTVTSATATSAVSISDYEAQYQAVGASTWTTVSLGTDRTGNITVGSSTNSYYVQTRAVSSEGNGAWSTTSTIAGLPTAPASISVTRTGRNVTVTRGTSTGTGITSYSVQYDDGSGWTGLQDITSGSYTYTNLPAAETYNFRVYATNAIGNSAYTTTASGTFVPAGGRRWDGSTWQPSSTAKRWDGTSWVDIQTAKRWDGTSWQDMS